MPDPTPTSAVDMQRLVDGELHGESLQQLVAGLEHSPTQWRQVALLFLESQALARELGPPRVGDSERKPDEAATCHRMLSASGSVAAPRSRSGYAWSGKHIVAAGVTAALLGFIAGTNARHGTQTNAITSPPGVAAATDDPSTNFLRSDDAHFQEPVRGNSSDAAQSVAENAQVQADPVQADQFQGTESEMPVYVSNVDDLRRWWELASHMPADMRTELLNSGYHIHRDIQLVPVATQDGRWGFVPIDQLEITPVANELL